MNHLTKRTTGDAHHGHDGNNIEPKTQHIEKKMPT